MVDKKKDAASRNQKRRDEAEKMHEIRAKKAKLSFERLSNDATSLKESLVEEFLNGAIHARAKHPGIEKHAVQLVIDSARKKQKRNKGTNNVPEGYLEKNALLEATAKYGDYVLRSREVDAIFDRFDTNKDGVLSRKELWNLLKEHEKEAHRHAPNHIVVTDDDLKLVLEKSDFDNSGKISREEVLPAIAAWEELVSIKVEQQVDCCIIL